MKGLIKKVLTSLWNKSSGVPEILLEIKNEPHLNKTKR